MRFVAAICGSPRGLVDAQLSELLGLLGRRGRQRRPRQYDFQAVKDRILVPRELRFEVTERVDYAGNVIVPLEDSELTTIIATLKEKKVEAVAVSFLFSFLNGQHEQTVKEILQESCPGMSVFISSEVLPEYREYERTSTVALNAALSPVVSRYVENLQSRISAEAGINVGMNLMKSSELLTVGYSHSSKPGF